MNSSIFRCFALTLFVQLFLKNTFCNVKDFLFNEFRFIKVKKDCLDHESSVTERFYRFAESNSASLQNDPSASSG